MTSYLIEALAAIASLLVAFTLSGCNGGSWLPAF
jgi:predicted small secreted protein